MEQESCQKYFSGSVVNVKWDNVGKELGKQWFYRWRVIIVHPFQSTCIIVSSFLCVNPCREWVHQGQGTCFSHFHVKAYNPEACSSCAILMWSAQPVEMNPVCDMGKSTFPKQIVKFFLWLYWHKSQLEIGYELVGDERINFQKRIIKWQSEIPLSKPPTIGSAHKKVS